MSEAYGVINDADLLEFRQQLVNVPTFDPNMCEFTDFRSVEKHGHTLLIHVRSC